MSSIIDDLIFYRGGRAAAQSKPLERTDTQENLNTFLKKLQLSEGAFIVTENTQLCEFSQRLQNKDMNYCVRMQIDKKQRHLKLQARLLSGSVFKKIPSRETEILLLKEIAKWHFMGGRQSVLYVHRGSLKMVNQVHLCLSEHLDKNKLNYFYNTVLKRSINQFSLFLEKHWDKTGNFLLRDQEQQQKLQKDLLLAQVLNTTATTFDLTEDSAQEKHFHNRMHRKRQDIAELKRNIVPDVHLESLIENFYEGLTQNVKALWIKNNFENTYSMSEVRFTNLLATSKYTGEKKIDDYIYNTVKVKVKDQMPKPFNEGGSSFIYVARVTLTYISSVDSTAYSQNQDKNERFLVMKKLKPELEQKYKHKLQHEKEVVSKLKGGCCYFIPKYYREEQALDAEDTLLMEYINGQELDYFVMRNHITISLPTKICLLLNVVHGLRYLASYGVVHLDLKPINIMVCRNLMTKVIDFGEAFHPDLCDKNYLPGYTFPYVAPEVFSLFQSSQQYRNAFSFSQKQDVFALGLIIADIIFSNKVYYFTNSKFREIYTRRENLERFFFNGEQLQGFGQSRLALTLAMIVVRCLDPDPSRRPTLDWIAVSLKLMLTSCSN